MPLSFEEFDPERLLPDDDRPEIYNLVNQENPDLVPHAQAKLRHYIESYKPTDVYKEVHKPSVGSIVIDASLGMWMLNRMISEDTTGFKVLYGAVGAILARSAALHIVDRVRANRAEQELSIESQRYIYLKFFERQES